MIIGVSGKIGSGKSEVARQIKKAFPEMNFKIKSYGYDVKMIASILTGINKKTILLRQTKSIYLEDWGMTVGEMFQKLATDAIRLNLHPNAWILSTFATHTDDQNWILDDVRFFNEANGIKDREGLMIRLEGDPKKIRENDSRDPNHISETELDNYTRFDIIYDNDEPFYKFEDLMLQVKNKM